MFIYYIRERKTEHRRIGYLFIAVHNICLRMTTNNWRHSVVAPTNLLDSMKINENLLFCWQKRKQEKGEKKNNKKKNYITWCYHNTFGLKAISIAMMSCGSNFNSHQQQQHQHKNGKEWFCFHVYLETDKKAFTFTVMNMFDQLPLNTFQFMMISNENRKIGMFHSYSIYSSY